jgi:hypothetical protein
VCEIRVGSASCPATADLPEQVDQALDARDAETDQIRGSSVQARCYAEGVLAGTKLRTWRYAVVVLREEVDDLPYRTKNCARPSASSTRRSDFNAAAKKVMLAKAELKRHGQKTPTRRASGAAAPAASA